MNTLVVGTCARCHKRIVQGQPRQSILGRAVHIRCAKKAGYRRLEQQISKELEQLQKWQMVQTQEDDNGNPT